MVLLAISFSQIGEIEGEIFNNDNNETEVMIDMIVNNFVLMLLPSPNEESAIINIFNRIYAYNMINQTFY